jgi:phosphate starvation-inducible protein PhoH and related proteins
VEGKKIKTKQPTKQQLPKYIRGKTINNREVLVIEEAQNFNENEMEALLTRLGKGGRIIMTGDNDQRDIKETYTGLSFAIEIAKNIEGIVWHKLKANHRSDLVGKILDFKYNK